MVIAIPKETSAGERRVALIPADVKKLVNLGAALKVEAGAGQACRHKDEDYQKAGATIVGDHKSLLAEADLVLKVRKPDDDDIRALHKGALLIGLLDPFQSPDTLKALCDANVSAIAMELIPRISRAQKMDVLSSQASLSGYTAVMIAADRLNKIFPMMMTPAGTISPARVFVIGAGVAGLQAIATAKRLGARVEAFDTRPGIEEQIQSLGAKFLKIDLGTTEQTKQGYAKELTPGQLQKQRDAMTAACASADVVITTAQIFGKKAPIIITAPMLAAMSPGSLVIDLAVESGGNVEGVIAGKEIDVNGVSLIGLLNLPSRICASASQMYSSNMISLVESFWDKENKTVKLNPDDEILKSCLVTHQKEIVNPLFKGRAQ